jgi:hypothetical protein
MQVTRMFYENALYVEQNLRGLRTNQHSVANPVQQICVYLRSSAVNILFNFIQLITSLKQFNRLLYTTKNLGV